MRRLDSANTKQSQMRPPACCVCATSSRIRRKLIAKSRAALGDTSRTRFPPRKQTLSRLATPTFEGLMNHDTTFPVAAVDLSLGNAVWRHRSVLAEHKDQIRELSKLIAKENNLPLFQWTQLMALALDFQPDLILELGRYKGNSTCAFNQVAHIQEANCRIESICITDAWAKSRNRIASIVPDSWFAPIHINTADILHLDYESILGESSRVFVFWDAHGFDVASCVLGKILPLLKDRDHVVAMHDIADTRYRENWSTSYNDLGIWRTENTGRPQLQLGHLRASVCQAVSIFDFACRNKLTLNTADHQLQKDLEDSDKVEQLQELLGDCFSMAGGWIWFSLNQQTGPAHFPVFENRPTLSWSARLKIMINVLRHGVLP